MKVLFKNRTKYTPEVYQTFLKFHQKKYGFQYQLYTAFITFLFLFCLVAEVSSHNYTLAIIFCIALTIFSLWRYFHPIHEVTKEFESDKIINEKEFSFRFGNKYFEVMEQLKSVKLKYYKIHRVFETDDFFYLYIDKKHAFLLEKEKFVIGNVSDFSNFIQKKCPFRFKKIN